MRQHAFNINPATHISIEHCADQVNAVFAHDVGNAQIPIHDLVNAVEGVFFVDDRVQEDAESPDVLLFAAVGFPG
jgi:hypothetical protein